MAQVLQAIRGMSDVLPQDATYWRYLESQLIQLASSYGYQEIRFPIVEQTALFKRSIGEATDIVEKEMYTFEDRNGDSLTLRPEGTAVCVRAGIEHGLLYNQIQRLWYLGPMFRHERPQKGRYRQFHQFGIEAFGMSGADIEAEIILLSAELWQRLGLQAKLQINSLGSAEDRARYRQGLVDYFTAHQTELDEDSQRRLVTNPLRILDSKNPAMQAMLAKAPVLSDSLSEASAQQFQQLCQLLDRAGVEYEINPRLVRGLDYYNGCVFEWVTDQLGAQSAICSGGRYDSLVELLGGKPTPAVGFALGIERVIALLQQARPLEPEAVDVYVVLAGEAAEQQGLLLAQQWRQQSGRSILVNCGGGSIKSQFKRADKSGAKVALVIGDNELAAQKVTVKFLREEKPQVELLWSDVAGFLKNLKT